MHARFVLENPQRRQVVLDALKRDQHRLAIRRDRAVVRGTRELDLSPPAAGVEDGLRDRGLDRPVVARGAEQLRECRAFEAGGDAERDGRIVRGDRHTDLLARRRDAPLGTGDVRPPLEQLGRHADGDSRRRGGERRGRQRERRWRLAEQQRDGVFRLRALNAHVDRLRLRRLQLGLRLHDVGLRRHAGRIPVLRHLQILLVAGNRVVEELLLCVQHAQREVVLREGGLVREPCILDVARARLRARLIGADRAPDAAPEIRRP